MSKTNEEITDLFFRFAERTRTTDLFGFMRELEQKAHQSVIDRIKEFRSHYAPGPENAVLGNLVRLLTTKFITGIPELPGDLVKKYGVTCKRCNKSYYITGTKENIDKLFECQDCKGADK